MRVRRGRAQAWLIAGAGAAVVVAVLAVRGMGAAGGSARTPVAVPAAETPAVWKLGRWAAWLADTGDADDPAIWVHPSDPARSLVIGTLKSGGLGVYDLEGRRVQRVQGPVLYNNVDVVYDFPLGGGMADLAVVSDRRTDRVAIYAIDPLHRTLTELTDPGSPVIFTPAGTEPNPRAVVYGLATYRSPRTGRFFAFVSRSDRAEVAQLELVETGGQVAVRLVRNLRLPAAQRTDSPVQGLAADNELGFLYAAQENGGIWKFPAEPDADGEPTRVDSVRARGGRLAPQIEGLTLYYASGGQGYLLAASQGANAFAVYAREADNDFLGQFRVGAGKGIDGAERTDGAHVVNLALGPLFPRGLLVVNDGVKGLLRRRTNFKYVPWEEVARAFGPDRLLVDTDPSDPGGRHP